MADYYISTAADTSWTWWNSTATTANNDSTWSYWATTAGSTATTITNITWGEWNVAYPAGYRYQVNPVRERTPEEIAATEAARARAGEEYRKRREEEQAAVAAAEKLLVENLHPVQRRRYRKHGHFDVQTRSGRRFRILRGWAGNVRELDDQDRYVASYCIHPGIQCPQQDNMLAQKLLLETDEERFLRIANRTPMAV